MESAQPSDWRRPDPDNTLYLDLPAGRVIIELAPRFAPQHVANIKALAREKFFDGLPVARVQDNFVAQWGDVDKVRTTEAAARKLPDETRHSRGASRCPSSNYPTRMATRPRPAGSTVFPSASNASLPDRCG